jgi:hypothetical protein
VSEKAVLQITNVDTRITRHILRIFDYFDQSKSRFTSHKYRIATTTTFV